MGRQTEAGEICCPGPNAWASILNTNQMDRLSIPLDGEQGEWCESRHIMRHKGASHGKQAWLLELWESGQKKQHKPHLLTSFGSQRTQDALLYSLFPSLNGKPERYAAPPQMHEPLYCLSHSWRCGKTTPESLFPTNVFRIRSIKNFKTFNFHENSAQFYVQAVTTIMGKQSKNKEKLGHTGQNHAEWQEATASRQHSTCPILLHPGSPSKFMPVILSSFILLC